MDGPADSFAVAVIRAWIELDVPGTVRIRIVRHRPGAAAEDTIGVTSSAREAGEIVARWLEEFLRTAAPPDGPARHGTPTGN